MIAFAHEITSFLFFGYQCTLIPLFLSSRGLAPAEAAEYIERRLCFGAERIDCLLIVGLPSF